MATTRLMPLHAGKGRSVSAALDSTTNYVKNPDKTDDGEWITSYECDPTTVDQEFLFSKRQYAPLTGREPKDSDVIAYHLRQSFKPGEIDPGKANQIGYDLAMSLTKGNHAFIVCTHVKRGKYLAFQIPGGKRFVRCDSLGADYSEAAIVERISGKRVVAPKKKSALLPAGKKPNLLIDIQAKLHLANSPGFEHWAKIQNLKEMAKTLLYLQENGLDDYAILEKACDAAGARFDALADKTKAAEQRMKKIAELQKYIGTYMKTREVYAQYRKLPPKKANRFYEEHTVDILSCQSAKRYFDSIGMKKLPPMQSLKQEYATLLAENKKRYPEFKEARAKMIDLMTAKSNTDRILGLTSEQEKQPRRQREDGR